MGLSYIIKEAGYTSTNNQGKERRSGMVLALKILMNKTFWNENPDLKKSFTGIT